MFHCFPTVRISGSHGWLAISVILSPLLALSSLAISSLAISFALAHPYLSSPWTAVDTDPFAKRSLATRRQAADTTALSLGPEKGYFRIFYLLPAFAPAHSHSPTLVRALVPHLRAALATQSRHVPNPSGQLYEVSRRAEACATVFNHPRQTDPVSSPDVAALTRGLSPSTPTRSLPLQTYIRRLASRGGLRDHSRRFTPPKSCTRCRPFPSDQGRFRVSPRIPAARAAFVPQHPGLVTSPISLIPFKMSKIAGHPFSLPLSHPQDTVSGRADRRVVLAIGFGGEFDRYSFGVFFVFWVPPAKAEVVVSVDPEGVLGYELVPSFLKPVPRVVDELDVPRDPLDMDSISFSSVKTTSESMRVGPIGCSSDVDWKVF
ncbi:hypothetical protein EDB89DRAFT_2231880 [Lactarius sanguifluus]|nr:hypothetical protein EDB89DRAFT_2231880 [Lactarius sanguifluus]